MNAPGPQGWRLLRDLLQMRRNRIALVTRAIREHGDVAEFRIGRRRMLLAAHPDAVRRVLVDNAQNYRKGLGLSDARALLGDGLLTSEGELWSSRRKVLQNALHGERFDGFGAAIRSATDRVARRWSEGGAPIDLGRDMLRLTFTAFARGVLGADLEFTMEQALDDFEIVERWAMQRSVSLLQLPIALPTPANLAVRSAISRLERVAANMLDGRAGPPTSLIAAIGSLDSSAGSRASRDELLTLLLAGHETTGAALAWAWYCLAQHPDVAARLQREVDTVLGDRDPEPADVARLPLVRAVFDETCRLYPPVWLIPRKAIGADQICGRTVAPGADVLLVIYLLHRHAGFWDRPDAFNPDRFLASSRHAAYAPFGAGPRACLGSRLAALEGVLVLSALARRFEVYCDPIAPAELNPRLTLHFPRGQRAWIRPRQLRKRGEAPGSTAA